MPRNISKRAKSNRISVRRSEHEDILTEKQKKQAFVLIQGVTDPGSGAAKLARDIIDEMIINSARPLARGDELLLMLSLAVSANPLPGYTTLDTKHIKDIQNLVSGIEKYIDDVSQKRPLNFLMLASPGAGKSHFIKCVAKQLKSKNVQAITFNMAGMQSNDDLMPPLDAARNLKMEDMIPLLFLDEFDSNPAYYAMLLPLLWDGEINLKQRDLKLGKLVIVLAGSGSSLPETMAAARSMRLEPLQATQAPKLVDLFSRINGGVLEIPPFFDLGKNVDRRADKVAVAVELLRKRFGMNLHRVPLGLLKFIALSEFRYGVRSIAHLIDLISYKTGATQLQINGIDLPLSSADRLKESSLAYHVVHSDQVHGVVDQWRCCAKLRGLVGINHEQILPPFRFRTGLYDLEDLLGFALRRFAQEVRE